MPSVITTTRSSAASTASSTAALAWAGGTKTTETFAPVAAFASPTESKTGTGRSSKVTPWPPLPGVTPPTIRVPAAIMRAVCLRPSEPVMPCTTTREVASNQIDIVVSP
jgi:hypothetical protein